MNKIKKMPRMPLLAILFALSLGGEALSAEQAEPGLWDRTREGLANTIEWGKDATEAVLLSTYRGASRLLDGNEEDAAIDETEEEAGDDLPADDLY